MAVGLADQFGYGFTDLIKIGLAKMMNGNYSDWDHFTVRPGYFEEKPQTLVQNNFDFSGQEEAIKKSRQSKFN